MRVVHVLENLTKRINILTGSNKNALTMLKQKDNIDNLTNIDKI